MLLTKSKYIIGLQCPRCLWVMMHEKARIPEPDAATQHLFDQGHLAGNLAKSCFPGGIDISEDDFMKNINTTKELLKKRKPLFEAGIMADNLYSRADVLRPAKKDAWDIIEVKSSTQVKDVHIQDVAFQKHCYEKANLKINKCFLMHINNKYVRKGKIDPKQLFIIEDITEQVNQEITGIQDRIKELFKAINKPKCPEIKIGPFCSKPYECALTHECWNFEDNSVFKLYSDTKKGFELFDNGITNIKDIPDDYKLTTNQQIQKTCEKTKKPFIDQERIKGFLNSLKYPLYYLDFETYSTTIPLYDDLKPYQQLPFQFSLHIQEKNGEITHKEFLAEGKGDPRKEIMKALKESLGEKGHIIVYNQGFEIGRLREMAEVIPGYKAWTESIIQRITDLLVPFRKFYYYSPKQQGSASLKKVLPAITGKDYSHLEISEGETASLQYLNITHGEVTEEEKKKVRKQLLEYCCLDTEGMVWIVDELRKLAG